MNPIGSDLRRAVIAIDQHPIAAGAGGGAAIAAVAVTILCFRWLARSAAGRGWHGEKAGTLVAAAIATGVSAQGMWVFMGDTLHLTIVLRVMFFGFLETMTLTSAMRARTAQRATESAGVDGIAMWVLTSLSAVLSATDAHNLGTLLIRLIAPLVAAWGWERSMALERRLRTGHARRINWRLTPERLLIRFGVADPDPQRNASDDAAQRSLIAVALAVDDARVLRDADEPNVRKLRKAQQRLRRAMRRATTDGGLVPFTGQDRRAVLLEHIAVLRSTSALLDIDVPVPWPNAEQQGSSAPLLRIDAQQSASMIGRSVDEVAHVMMSARATSTEADCTARSNDTDLHASIVDSDAIGDHRIWVTVAEQMCAHDPARRRRPCDVEAILRLHHVEHRTYSQIARQVDGFSKHAVGRVIRQARKYHPTLHAGRGADQ